MDGSYEFPSSATGLPRYTLTVVGGREKTEISTHPSSGILHFLYLLRLYKMKCSLTIRVSGNFWLLLVPLVWTHASSQETQPKNRCKIVVGWMHTFLMSLAAKKSHYHFGGVSAAALLLPECLQGWSFGANEGRKPGLGQDIQIEGEHSVRELEKMSPETFCYLLFKDVFLYLQVDYL